MPTRVRRPPYRVVRYPARNRIMTISNQAQWHRLHRRGANKLVFVMFTLEYLRNGHRLRTTLAELSAHNEFKNVLFAVVDIDKASYIAEQEGIEEAPTFVVYKRGAVLERLEQVSADAVPANVWQMLHRNVVSDRLENANQVGEIRRVPRWRKMVKPLISIFVVAVSAVGFHIVKRKHARKTGKQITSHPTNVGFGTRMSQPTSYATSDVSSDED